MIGMCSKLHIYIKLQNAFFSSLFIIFSLVNIWKLDYIIYMLTGYVLRHLTIGKLATGGVA